MTRAPRRRRSRIRAWLVAAAATMLLTSSGALGSGVAASAPLGNPDVIRDWNLTAQGTLLGDTTKKPQEHFLYLAFLNIAMYDAIVGIDGRYVPYRHHAAPAADASDEAAAVGAAYRILTEYTPYAAASLLTTYTTAVGNLPHANAAEVDARDHGLAYGTLVANDLIALRANDGRNAAILYTKTPAPGIWRPTPPANLPMFVPWMGSVTPLVLKSGAQFGEPGLPYWLTDKKYTAEFNEVKAMGGDGVTTPTQRTSDQTATAIFFSGNAQVQYTGALIDQAAKRDMDIVDTSRMFAAVNTSIADALIAVWHSKLLYGFWRPITAIREAGSDGNDDTVANTTWAPLLTNTPPYPDYVSGYSGVTGAFTRSLQKTLGTGQLDVTLGSTAAAGTRHYDKAGAINDAVINARIWLGIHFRSADVDGVKMGQKSANWVLDHAFQPVGG
jgi:hypothetical protein